MVVVACLQFPWHKKQSIIPWIPPEACTPHSLVFKSSSINQDTPIASDIPTVRPDGLTQAMWAAVQENMNNSGVEMIRQANKKRGMSLEYKLCHLVKIHHYRIRRNSQYYKLELGILGPYPISAVYPHTDNYMLVCPLVSCAHLKVHTSLLAPWHSNNDAKFRSRSLPELGPVESDSQGDKWAFEHIVKHGNNKRNGVIKYWVKWEWYEDNQNTLESEGSLPPKGVKDYRRKHSWTCNQQRKRRWKRNK